MAGFADNIRFGYGNGYGNTGVVPSPMTLGMDAGFGASNPLSTYLQSYAPASSGISGVDPWAGKRDVSPLGAANTGVVPNVGGVGNNNALGWNLDTANLALGGLKTIGSLWQAWEANKLAKEQFAFQKDFANTNLANQIKSYNTTLEDKIRSRFVTEGKSDEDAQAYIDAHQLRRAQ